MAYLDFIDELSRGIKIVFAILLNPLFVIYRFIKDIRAKSWILLLLDCLFCLEFFFVFWFSTLFGLSVLAKCLPLEAGLA